MTTDEADYSVTTREQATDFMAAYEGFGEMRSYTGPLGCEQVAFTWRQMPPGTGGRGSYGHRHRTQEEVYFVVAGTITFKVGDDVFEAGPETAVRIAPAAVRSIHNDTDAIAEVILCSVRIDDLDGEVETEDGFWPE
jgi:mannose-6-phosphate isomerase-like protein (cupin superfamily)